MEQWLQDSKSYLMWDGSRMDLWTASKINASQYTTQAVMAVLFWSHHCQGWPGPHLGRVAKGKFSFRGIMTATNIAPNNHCLLRFAWWHDSGSMPYNKVLTRMFLYVPIIPFAGACLSDVVSQKMGALQCLPDEISQGTRSECQGYCMLESFHDEVSPSPAMGLARSPLKNGLTTCTPYLIRSGAFNWKVFGWVGKPIRQTKMEMCSFLVQSRGVAKNW